ncbi:leader peptidase (prepilin peptidase) / N-methyltransferase [Desulfosporosinus hippei DSM 8344]|uniref:Prepilin leader peptidase/N-methyltransferase n=2 Tax=Desulfosporosinus TaxID=79206 RepID=A0A1G8GCN4_9FIRM|nr:leader peptidase (prepilin peptidase) / N-methyltransferase [Desulfosporosinus hippei DSM 8344]
MYSCLGSESEINKKDDCMLMYGIIFIFGFIMGSFLNVCIYRIPRGESIVSPAAHCPNCGTRLKPFDLLPLLSYLIHHGKCRYCDRKISPRYHFVELLTGIVCVTLFIKYGLTVDFLAFLFLTFILIAVFFIDLDHQIIPNQLVITGLIGGAVLFVYNLFLPFQIYSDDRWWNPLLGLVSGSGFLFGVSLIGLVIYKGDEVMGMGDVKLFAPIGLFLGWRMTLLALFLSVVLGGMLSLLLILFGKATRRSRIPFGPFIVIGTFTTIMWGWQLLHWYVNNYLYY